MSPRAAWRLERLGFGAVHDYAAGKVDWIAAGLATVRRQGGRPRVVEALDRHVATCRPDDTATRVGERLRTAGEPYAVVVNEERVVLGRLRARDADHPGSAEDAMEPGPVTVRAHADLAETLARLQSHNVRSMLVTTPDGRLLGVLRVPAGTA